VVAFNICGLPDIVEHQRTGYLAKAFETEDLASGIRWVLGNGSPRFLRNLAMTGEEVNMLSMTEENSAAHEGDGVGRGKPPRDADAMLGDLRKQSRERAVARFSNAVVAEQYRAVYAAAG
jgi:glycosyltransferase involved in cell wall biosynthesis